MKQRLTLTVLQTFLRASIATVVLSTALICTLVDQHHASLWPLTALLGAGYATIMGSSFAWANSFTQVLSRLKANCLLFYITFFLNCAGLEGRNFGLKSGGTYQFRRRKRRSWVPRRKGANIPLIQLWGLWERRELCERGPGRCPGLKWYYCNLISADRFCR